MSKQFKLINDVLNMETIIASALILMTILCVLAFFFNWISLIMAIAFGIASFGYYRQITK